VNSTKSHKSLLNFPWGFPEGFLVSAVLFVLGTAIDFAGDTRFVAPQSPVNVVFICIFSIFIILSFIFFKKHPIIQWLASVPAAITSSIGLTFSVLLMGFILQDDAQASDFVRRAGLSHVTESRAFFMLMLFFLTALGFATVKRFFSFRKKDIAFALNHLGLWIVVVAGGFGASDTMRLRMLVQEDAPPVFSASDANSEYEMPLAVRLIDFNMETYSPKFAVADTITGKIRTDMPIYEISKQKQFDILNFKITIDTFLTDAAPLVSHNTFLQYHDKGAAPAAKIHLSNSKNDSIRTAWISSGSYLFSSVYVPLDSVFALVMLAPEPKLFSSEVEIFTQSGLRDTVQIEVNKPFKTEGWKIYQLGYDEAKGKSSDVSILELVRDPWLPVVYIGFFMLIIGAFMLIFKNSNISQKVVKM